MSPYTASPTLGARVGRRVVALCLFCEDSPLPVRGAPEEERWAPLAPAIRDAIVAGTDGFVVSHGLCPRCARERYPELMS